MFEIEGHKSTIIGLALGGIFGFMLHKNSNLSISYGIAIGSVLGLIIGLQVTLEQRKKASKIQSNKIERDSLGMPKIRPLSIEEERASLIAYYKTLPDNFTIKKGRESVNYTKNSNLEFYKTPFIPDSFSGVQPIKINGAEFSEAYLQFRDKDLPKSAFELKFGV